MKALYKVQKETLYQWQNRGLSLYDRIQVVNSLIYSKFVYRLTNLPLLSKEMLHTYNAVVSKFIWDNKKPKIQLKMLSQNKEAGGAGLINFELKDKALKIGWIFKLIKDPKLANLAYEIMPNPIKDLVWQINLDPDHIRLFFRKGFWSDVLYAWMGFTRQDKLQICWINK